MKNQQHEPVLSRDADVLDDDHGEAYRLAEANRTYAEHEHRAGRATPHAVADLAEWERLAMHAIETDAAFASAKAAREFDGIGALHWAASDAALRLADFATAERVAQLVAAARAGAEDTARLDWLEAHDYSPTCWNVPDTLDATRWAAPMKPNNGWTIALGDEDECRDEPGGTTLRDAIDWAKKVAARASRPPSGADDATG